MWRALIADDEAFSRYALQSFLVKGDYPIEVIAEAADGDEAVELSMKLKPDLIFLDIKMPGQNGIEAAGKIRKALPSSKIIMLTAYDHFNYIQQALDIGVKGYLLKPFQQEELSFRITSILSELDAPDTGDAGKESAVLKRYAESELMDLLLFPSGSSEREAALLKFLKLPPPRNGLLLLSELSHPSERHKQRLCTFPAAYTNTQNIRFLLGRGYGVSLIALFPSLDHSLYNILVDKLKKERKETGVKRAVLVPFFDRETLPAAFRNALAVLEQQEPEQINLLEPFSCKPDSPEGFSVCPEFPYTEEDALFTALEQGRFDDAEALLEELSSSFDELAISEPELIDHLTELLVLIRRSALRAGCRFDRFPCAAPVRNLPAFKDIPDGFALLGAAIAQYKEAFGRRVDELPVWKLSRAFLFIRRNLFNDLGLEQVADLVGLSPQYLSKRFKEEYGKSFTEYVTSERMHRARFLLGTTTLSVKEICSFVGYSDANYFSRVFKKETGFTPQLYRDHTTSASGSF